MTILIPLSESDTRKKIIEKGGTVIGQGLCLAILRKLEHCAHPPTLSPSTYRVHDAMRL